MSTSPLNPYHKSLHDERQIAPRRTPLCQRMPCPPGPPTFGDGPPGGGGGGGEMVRGSPSQYRLGVRSTLRPSSLSELAFRSGAVQSVVQAARSRRVSGDVGGFSISPIGRRFERSGPALLMGVGALPGLATLRDIKLCERRSGRWRGRGAVGLHSGVVSARHTPGCSRNNRGPPPLY